MEKKKFNFTILTPSYNRALLLPAAYHSLLNQKIFDFEWVIVDDGSMDNTKEIVKKWQNETNLFPIHYIKKENGGKHTAINKGIGHASGKYIIILDSDDQLTPGAIEIYTELLPILEEKNLGGIISTNVDLNNQTIGSAFPQNNVIADFETIYYKWKVKGDKGVLWKTELLKKYLFPEPENIKFVSELCVWHPLSKNHQLLCINSPIFRINYQTEGISNSSYKKWFLEGMAFTNYYLIKENIHPFLKYPKIRWQEYVQMIINSTLSHKSYFNKLSFIDKFFYVLAFPRSFYSARNMKKYVKHYN